MTQHKHQQLSKWWKTKSCRDAFKRAKARKRASLDKFLKARKAKLEAQHKEIWGYV